MKMTYRPTYARIASYAVPLAFTAAALAGCATRDRVIKLENRVSGLELKTGALEQKPNAERPISLRRGCKVDGRNVDALYDWLRGRVLPQYQNPDARKDAEANANMITLVPTGVAGAYYAVVMDDANRDCTASKGDFTFPDGQRVQTIVKGQELPRDLRFLLLEVTKGQK